MIKEIAYNAFEGLSKLESINIAENNSDFNSIDGVLFSNSKLLLYPLYKKGDTYVIPDGTIEICEKAFNDCTFLTSITFNSDIKNVQSTSFYNCKKLKSINTGDNLNFISEDGVLYNKNHTILIYYPTCKEETSLTIQDPTNSINSYAFYGCINLKFIDIKVESSIKFGEYAFAYCSKLESLNMEKCNGTIDKYAFYNSTNLKTINIPNIDSIDSSIFRYCYNLASIKLSNNLKSIPDEAFEFCYSIQTINLPSCLEYIGYNSFSCCINLISIDIQNNVTYIGSGSFYRCISLKSIKLPQSIEEISNKLFFECRNLTSINIQNVKYIGREAFGLCISLKSITLSENLTRISSETFMQCYNLEDIILPKNMETIDNNAFEYCSSLTSINLPASVLNIYNYAFDSCSKLESINIDYSNTKYMSIDGVLFSKNGSELIIYPNGKILPTYDFPNNITTIKDYAFRNNKNLVELYIPDTVTCIEKNAFESCHNLESISLPKNLTKIKECTFQNCQNLISIKFSENLDFIERHAFYNCNNLKTLSIPISVSEIRFSAFVECNSLTTIKYDGKYDILSRGDVFVNCMNIEKVIVESDYLHNSFLGIHFNKDGSVITPIIDQTYEPIQTSTPAPISTIIETIDVPENSNSADLDKLLTSTFEKMKKFDNTNANYIIVYNCEKVAFNSKLDKNQFIKPSSSNSEVLLEGGNLNLLLPDSGKVKVTFNDEKNDLSINGNGKLEINQPNSLISSIHLNAASYINGSFEMEVSENVNSITIDTIEMEKESTIFIKSIHNKYINVYVNNIKVNSNTDAEINNMNILNSIHVVQTGILKLDNISFNNVKINFELSDLEKQNGWSPFIIGNFNNAPNKIILNKHTNSVPDPKIKEDFTFISGMFKDQKCEEWLDKIDFGNSNFDTKKCIDLENSLLLSENKQIVLCNENSQSKSTKKDKKIPIIVGCVCGIVVIIIIIIVIVVVFKRKKVQNKE